MKLPKRLMAVLVAFTVLVGWLALILPQNGVNRVIAFDPGRLPDDPDACLAASEAKIADVTPGPEKRIARAGAPGQTAPVPCLIPSWLEVNRL